jgi:hypothetical protein
MKFFYLSTEPNNAGKFEIHERDCVMIPSVYHRDYLGPFNSGKEAFSKAKGIQTESTLCPQCSSSNYVAVFAKMNRENS